MITWHAWYYKPWLIYNIVVYRAHHNAADALIKSTQHLRRTHRLYLTPALFRGSLHFSDGMSKACSVVRIYCKNTRSILFTSMSVLSTFVILISRGYIDIESVISRDDNAGSAIMPPEMLPETTYAPDDDIYRFHLSTEFEETSTFSPVIISTNTPAFYFSHCYE